ncbi:MAG: phosphoglycerate dehydrogenase [Coriobacteriia bacterium]|nr:phosphoglycerate dehydrogenase [Coriobacteriia bacterium]
MPMKILVAEKMAQEGIDSLVAKGYQVDIKPDLSRFELLRAVRDYDALIVRSGTKVDEELFEAAQNLKVVGRAGVGVDNIDIDAATAHGVIVCNAPTSNIISAAELTMALLLDCARNVAAADHSMKAGKWERSRFDGVELHHKTLAIFGLGRVGRLVAERAAAFGMNVIAHDPFCSRDLAEATGVKLYENIDDVLAVADFITVHLPKTESTIGMFGPEEFAKMKDGVIVVNAARGGIFNVKALSDFVAAGKVRAAAVDVWEEEPCLDSPLHEFEQVTLTPHLGASTEEAQRRAGIQIADYVDAGLQGSLVPTALNIAPTPPEVVDLVAPYIPACQLMGSMMVQVNGHVAKRLKITAAGDFGAGDLDSLTAGFLDGMLSYRTNKRVTPANAKELAARHGIALENKHYNTALEFNSYVRLEADGQTVSCTLISPDDTPQIVELLGYRVDMELTGKTLIFEYVDGPGRMGVIGTILGNAGISITTMKIARKEGSENALVYMNVDQAVPTGILEELREQVKPTNLWYIKL